jgi:hypothetical protein
MSAVGDVPPATREFIGQQNLLGTPAALARWPEAPVITARATTGSGDPDTTPPEMLAVRK